VLRGIDHRRARPQTVRALVVAALLVACTAHHSSPPFDDVTNAATAWHSGRITTTDFDARVLHDLHAVAAWRDADPTPSRQLWVEWTRLTLDEPDAPAVAPLAQRAHDLAQSALARV